MNLFSNQEKQILSMLGRDRDRAMSMLYADFSGCLTGIAARYINDADRLKDVLQESFIRIFTQIDRFEYRGRGSLQAWMSRIVVNEALKEIKKEQGALLLDAEPPDIAEEAPPDTQGLSADVLAEMIRRLPAGYRAVFNLYVVEGLSHKQIAQQLGIKENSSASQLHHAKQMLARMINDYNKHHSS